MKLNHLILSALLLIISVPVSAKNSPKTKPDTIMVVMEQYATALKAEQKAETAYAAAYQALRKAQEAVEEDTANAGKKKILAAAEVKADSTKQVFKSKQKESQDLKLKWQKLIENSPVTLPLWLAAVLGVLLVGISIICGMRLASKGAKASERDSQRNNNSDANDIKLVCKEGSDDSLFKAVEMITTKSLEPYQINENEKVSSRRNGGKASKTLHTYVTALASICMGKKASNTLQTYLLQTMRVPANETSINQFRLSLENYYGQDIKKNDLENVLRKGYTQEGSERCVYHLPLRVSTEKKDGYTKQFKKDGKCYYYKPIEHEPNYEALFADLDQLLSKISTEEVAPDTTAAQPADAPASQNQQTEERHAENVNAQGNTVVWNVKNATTEQAPCIRICATLINNILRARHKEKSALQDLMHQRMQDVQSLSNQEELSSQLAAEQKKNKQLISDKKQLTEENNDLNKKLKETKSENQKISQTKNKLTTENQYLKTEKQKLNKEVASLHTQVKKLKADQATYSQAIDFWPELQPLAQQLLQFLDSCHIIEKHAETMSSYNEGIEDDRNYYLVRIARKLHEQLSDVASTIEPLRAELPLLAQHKMVRTDGWFYSKLQSVRDSQRDATLRQLIEKPIIQILNATVIAADEYAYWLPEMIGVSDSVTREFIPLRDDVLAKAKSLGLKVGHIQPFTPMDPNSCQAIEFWPNEQHRWKPSTVIEVLSLAIDGKKAEVKATQP